MPRRSGTNLAALFLGMLLGCSPASGADLPSTYFTRSWLADEGLPTSSANDVVQDADGFLWVATPEGVVRFDGVQFKMFTSPLIAKAAAQNIRALAINTNGAVLLLPALGGVVELSHGQFRSHPAAAGLEGMQLRDIFVERSGAIWLEIAGGRVRRWHSGHGEDFGPAEGLNERAKASFAESTNGAVWVASGGYVGRYENGKLHSVPGDRRYPAVVASSSCGGVWVCKGTVLRKLERDSMMALSTNLPWVAVGGVVREMFEDREGGLWIGTAAHGLFRWANGQFAQVGSFRNEITAIRQDTEGSVWVTSDGNGLTRLRRKTFQLFDSAAGIAQDVCDSVAADERGDVWVANRGGGVARISSGQAETIRLPEGSHRLRAYAVGADNRGGVWVSEAGLYRFEIEPPHALATVSNAQLDVHAFFLSRNGDMWVGGEAGFLGHYKGSRRDAFVPEETFPGNRIRCIAEDVSGSIWIGTEGGRLFCKTNGKFIEFDQSDELPEAPIRSLYADASGNVWVGTIGGGLVLGQNGKFVRITFEDGLPDNNIAAILEDDHGRLWFGSRGGIFHVAKADLESFCRGTLSQFNAVTFDRSEGLYGVSCVGSVQPMACKTSDGRLWFATRQGVVSLDVNRMEVINRPPPVFVDEVMVNNRKLAMSTPMKLPPLCKRVEFRFAVTSFAAPEKVRVRYLLEGVDSDWTEIVGRREAVYTGLGPGQYQLRVKACNSDGVWNEIGATLAFAVQPTWWQLWWVRGVAVAIAALGLSLGVRHWSHRRLKRKLERLEQQQALEQERTRIARDLHDDLGATVTQVGLMMEELAHTPPAESEWQSQAGQVSSRIRNLARDLDAVVWSVNPGNDTLRNLAGYVSQYFLETLRHSAIRPRLQVSEGIPEVLLKPEIRHHFFLIAKEAVNNIIKHATATEATLGLTVEQDHFELRIQDNGRGFDPDVAARTRRNGLRNMRVRAEELGCVFEVSTRPGAGTVVLVRLPLPKVSGGRD